MDELFVSRGDLFIGRVLEGAAEVFAVDLAVTQKGAKAGVEDLRGGERGSDQTSGSYQKSPTPTAFSGREPRAS